MGAKSGEPYLESVEGKPVPWSTQWHADPGNGDYPYGWTYWDLRVSSEMAEEGRVRFTLRGGYYL